MNINVSNVKICVTIPVGKTEEIRDAICNVGAGKVNQNYSFCSTITKCTGTFKPSSSANPYIGEKDTLSVVDEEKLEVICDIKKVKEVISVLKSVHPYEEPAIDIIPLIDLDSIN